MGLFYRLYAVIFARRIFVPLHKFLFNLSIRGLGILNYQTVSLSGERYFLAKTLKDKFSPIIFDVGANIGNYTSMIRDFSPKAIIYCFEPHPLNLVKLRNKQELCAKVIGCAVGECSGYMELFDYADDDGSSHASVYREVIEEIHCSYSVSHTVEVITLDEYCIANNIQHIDLLKIDTEGHELAVLSGAKNLISDQRIDIIHFEFNEMNIISRVFLRDFCSLLKGFTFYRLLPKGWIPLKCNGLDEIFAFQNIVAVRDGALSVT